MSRTSNENNSSLCSNTSKKKLGLEFYKIVVLSKISIRFVN